MQCTVTAVLLPTPVLCGSHGEEAALNACGVGAAMLPGQSWVPPWLIDCWTNVGTISWLPGGRVSGPVRGRLAASCGPRGGAEAS